MKRFFIGIFVAFFCFLFIAPAIAQQVLVPTVEGDDVVFPDMLIQTVPDATDDNVYARVHNRINPWVKMTREGQNWRAPGVVGEDMNIYVGDPMGDYKPHTNFVKISYLWDTRSEFITFRGKDICFNVK